MADKPSIEELEELMDSHDVGLEILPDGTLKITETGTAAQVVELIKNARKGGDHY